MEMGSGLVAGSHNRNEIIIIRSNGEFAKTPLEQSSGKPCQICGDDVELSAEREVFVACNECAFPICRTCYEYERREGNQACPRCNTRFKRIKGCARVEGDDEEDDVDDLDNEFDFDERPLAAEIQPQERASFPPMAGATPISDPTIADRQNASSAVHPRAMDPSKDLALYGYGSIAWKEVMESWKLRQNKQQMMNNDGWRNLDRDDEDYPVQDMLLMDEARQSLSRKLPIRSSQINPYRMIIIVRLTVIVFFFHYRVTHPVRDAYILWLVSVICEILFAISWILDQFPKWLPVDRETYPHRLSLRYEKEGQTCQLSAIDIFVSTLDPSKEPPLVTANTLLSILAVDYPPHQVSCYVSDDAASVLTFEALSETAEFSRKWVPFCKKFKIEPRAPDRYFHRKIDYFSDKIVPSFVKERRVMKREYEEFKVRINSLVAKSKKVPDEGWTMQDGTLWPGNNGHDHPGMIQIFLGKNGGYDADGNELPCLVYISREKRPVFNYDKKAGAMNCLVRVSAVLTNAPYVLNLDCDQYINNSYALREAMCFMMDPLVGERVCYIQFQPCDRSAVFSDINMKGLDGIQGPIYVGTGCVFKRQALYGYHAPKPKKSPAKPCSCWLNWCCFSAKKHKRINTKPKAEATTNISRNEEFEDLLACSSEGSIDSKLAKKFGQSPLFAASMLGELKPTSPRSSLKEAIHVISCGYEDKTDWGDEVGWIYGSATSDMLTGLKMHCRGWRSIYYAPERPAFEGSPPLDLTDRLHQSLRSALGSIEIFFSKHCPVWYGYGGALKPVERLSYINATVYPWTSIPLVAYCTLPAVCLLTGKFIVTELGNVAGLWFISLCMCIFATNLLEMKWSGVSIGEWWRNERFWVVDGVSAHLFAVCEGLLKVIAGVEPSKTGDGAEFYEFYAAKWRILLVPPTTLLLLNMIGVVFGVSSAMNNGFESWGSLLGKLVFALWVIVHLYPLLKGVLSGQILVWSALVAALFSIIWVHIKPFSAKTGAPVLVDCGVDCV